MSSSGKKEEDERKSDSKADLSSSAAGKKRKKPKSKHKGIKQIRNDLPKILKKEGGELLEFATDFYKRLSRFNRNHTDDDGNVSYSYEVSRPNRRLDAIARLLEIGNSDCTAVSFDGTKMLVATNSISEDMQEIWDGQMDKTPMFPLILRIQVLRIHLGSIAMHINDLRSEGYDPSSYHEMIGSLRASLLGKCLHGAVKTFTKRTESQAVLFAEKMVDDFMSYEEKGGSRSPNAVDDWWEAKGLDGRLKKLGKIEKTIIKRYFKDIIKVEDYLSNLPVDDPVFQFFLGEGKVEIVPDGGLITHAEIRILMRYLRDGRVPEYIGISKLCCAHCNLIMQTSGVAQVVDDEELEGGAYIVRGFHANGYRWTFPEELRNNPAFMREFLGKNSKGKNYYDIITSLEGKVRLSKKQQISRIEFAWQCIEEICALSEKELCRPPFGLSKEEVLRGIEVLRPAESISEGEEVEYVAGIYYKNVNILILNDGSYFGRKLEAAEMEELLNSNAGGQRVSLPKIYFPELGIKKIRTTKEKHSVAASLTSGRIAENEYSSDVLHKILNVHFTADRENIKIIQIVDFNNLQGITGAFAWAITKASGDENIRIVIPIQDQKDGHWYGYIIRKHSNGNLHIMYIDPTGKDYLKNSFNEMIMQGVNEAALESGLHIKFTDLCLKQARKLRDSGAYLVDNIIKLANSPHVENTKNALVRRAGLVLGGDKVKLLRLDQSKLLYGVESKGVLAVSDGAPHLEAIRALTDMGYTKEECDKIMLSLGRHSFVEAATEIFRMIENNDLPFPPGNSEAKGVEERKSRHRGRGDGGDSAMVAKRERAVRGLCSYGISREEAELFFENGVVTDFWGECIQIKADGNCLYNSILIGMKIKYPDNLLMYGVNNQEVLREIVAIKLATDVDRGEYKNAILLEIAEDVKNTTEESDKLTPYSREFQKKLRVLVGKPDEEIREFLDRLEDSRLYEEYIYRVRKDKSFGTYIDITILEGELGVKLHINGHGELPEDDYIALHYNGIDHYDLSVTGLPEREREESESKGEGADDAASQRSVFSGAVNKPLVVVGESAPLPRTLPQVEEGARMIQPNHEQSEGLGRG